MSIYNLLPQWFLDLILPNGSDCTNTINLFLSLNFGYLIYIISFIKLELFNYLINTFNFFLMSHYHQATAAQSGMVQPAQYFKAVICPYLHNIFGSNKAAGVDIGQVDDIQSAGAGIF